MAIDKVNPKAIGETNRQNKKVITTKQLASIFFELADNNSGAVSTAEFQRRLKSLNKDNIVSFIKNYDNLQTGESFIEMIGDEVGNDAILRKETISKVFNLLIVKANEFNIDTNYYKTEFNKELDKEFNGWTWNGINASKLDEIINTLICNIEAQSNLTKDDKQKIENTSSDVAYVKTTNVFVNRLNSAIKAFNKQMQEDGWAGNVADFFGKWGKNNADDVRKDFNKCKGFVERLKDARLYETTGKNEPNSTNKFKTYAEEFKDIFGVDYNPANIVAYQKAEKEYIEVTTKNDIANNFKNKFNRLLKDDKLNAEYTTMISPTTGCGTQVLSKTKEQVFKEDFEAVANSINPKDGKTILEGMLKEAGLENASIDDKYKALHLLVDIQYKRMQDDLKSSLKGQTVEQVEAKYSFSYKAAFGLENDIMKRVIDYNVSQQKGAGLVKGVVIGGVALGATISAVASGGTSLLATSPVLAGMGLTAGLTAGVELTDALSKPKVQEAFKTGGVKEGLKAMDLENIVISSLVAGGLMGVMGGVGKGVQVLTSSLKFTPKMQIATAFGTDVALGIGSEYALTGEVSIEGVVFTVLISSTGTLLGMTAIKGQEAKLKTELLNARKTLGIADGVTITDDVLNQALISKGNLLNSADGNGLQDVQKAYNLLRTQAIAKPHSNNAEGLQNPQNVTSKTIAEKRAELKAKIRSGKILSGIEETRVSIPKGKLSAPSKKFAETPESFQKAIRDNAEDIKGIIDLYRHGELSKEEAFCYIAARLNEAYDIDGNSPEIAFGIRDVFGEHNEWLNRIELNETIDIDKLIAQYSHEVGHFFQAKETNEAFLAIYGNLDNKFRTQALSELRPDRASYSSNIEYENAVTQRANELRQLYERTNWQSILEQPKYRTNPNDGPTIQRGLDLHNASVKGYGNNYDGHISEIDSYSIGTATYIELQKSVMGTINDIEYRLLNDINIVLHENYNELPPNLQKLTQEINRYPEQFVDNIKFITREFSGIIDIEDGGAVIHLLSELY